MASVTDWETGICTVHSSTAVVLINVTRLGTVEALGGAYLHPSAGAWVWALFGAPRALKGPLEWTYNEVRSWVTVERQSQARCYAIEEVKQKLKSQKTYIPGNVHVGLEDRLDACITTPMWVI